MTKMSDTCDVLMNKSTWPYVQSCKSLAHKTVTDKADIQVLELQMDLAGGVTKVHEKLNLCRHHVLYAEVILHKSID